MPVETDRHQGLALSKRARDYLARTGRAENSDTSDRIAKQLIAAGLPSFPAVVSTFFHFGGYCLRSGSDGRFTVHRVRQALRAMRLAGNRSDDPERFRIPFGESETVQAWFLMDGNGRLYEDDRPLAAGIIALIEEWAAQSSG